MLRPCDPGFHLAGSGSYGSNLTDGLRIHLSLGTGCQNGNSAVGVTGDQRLPLCNRLANRAQCGPPGDGTLLNNSVPAGNDAADSFLIRRFLRFSLRNGNNRHTAVGVNPCPFQLRKKGKQIILDLLASYLTSGSAETDSAVFRRLGDCSLRNGLVPGNPDKQNPGRKKQG